MRRLAPIAILLYCAFQARSLLTDWGASPFMRFGSLAFIFWGWPFVWYSIKREAAPNAPLLIFALITSLAGVLGSLNALTHIGLALALLGTAPPSLLLIPWLFTAITWIPATAYFAKPLAPHLVTILRLIFASIGGTIGFLTIKDEVLP